jgi:hypothetical protein
MAKKAFHIILVFSILQLVMMISCGAPYTEYRKIVKIAPLNYDISKEVNLRDSAVISQKKFTINLDIDTEYSLITSNFNSTIFINSAYATSKGEPFYLGLNPKIESFNIICNKDILGINSGKVINSKLRVKTSDNIILTVDKWQDAMNRGVYKPDGFWQFEFSEPLNSDEFLVFEISLKLFDGTIFSEKTDAVKLSQ